MWEKGRLYTRRKCWCTPKPTCSSASVVLHTFTDQTSRQKVKCHPRKRACHKNNRCTDVKNSPGPFRLSFHRLDDCEISVGFTFRTALVGVSTNGMSLLVHPFFVFSVRKPNCSRIFVKKKKTYEDLLHVQNKCLAIRLSDVKTGKPLSSLPSSVVVATFREDRSSEPTCTDAQNLFLLIFWHATQSSPGILLYSAPLTHSSPQHTNRFQSWAGRRGPNRSLQ